MTTRPQEPHRLVYRCLICGGTSRQIAGTAIHLNENARYSDYDHNAVVVPSPQDLDRGSQ